MRQLISEASQYGWVPTAAAMHTGVAMTSGCHHNYKYDAAAMAIPPRPLRSPQVGAQRNCPILMMSLSITLILLMEKWRPQSISILFFKQASPSSSVLHLLILEMRQKKRQQLRVPLQVYMIN